MKSAWFLNKVEVEDTLNSERYVFPCDRWLATDEDDGQISRELPALTAKDFNAEQKRKMTRRQSTKTLVDSLDLESKGKFITFFSLSNTLQKASEKLNNEKVNNEKVYNEKLRKK